MIKLKQMQIKQSTMLQNNAGK